GGGRGRGGGSAGGARGGSRIDDFRHVGAAARAAEGGALPDAPGDQLEGARCDLRAGRRDSDDDGLAPAAMAGVERLAHDRDVATAVEGIVGAARTMRIPTSRKNFKYRWKSITQRSLT